MKRILPAAFTFLMLMASLGDKAVAQQTGNDKSVAAEESALPEHALMLREKAKEAANGNYTATGKDARLYYSKVQEWIANGGEIESMDKDYQVLYAEGDMAKFYEHALVTAVADYKARHKGQPKEKTKEEAHAEKQKAESANHETKE